MTFVTEVFAPLAHTVASTNGAPDLPIVAIEHPLVGLDAAAVVPRADRALELIERGLREQQQSRAAGDAVQTERERLEADDSFAGAAFVNELFEQRGWTDGLPIVPPDVDTVGRFLAVWGRDPSEVVVTVPPERGDATLEKIAVAMVMSGCEARYLPVVETALRAMDEESFYWLNSLTGTGMQTPLTIVSGPIRRDLGLNAAENVYGPGPRANATIGRALRLLFRNVGGLRDQATQGNPTKYSYVLVENQEANPWSPVHADYGVDVEASAVTVVTGQPPMLIKDTPSTTGIGILHTVCSAMSIPDSVNYNQFGDQVLVFAPEHAAIVAGDGFSKDDVKRFVYEHARVPVTKFAPAFVEKQGRHRWAMRFDLDDPTTRIPIVERPEDVIVVVAGGANRHSSFVPTYCQSRRVTREIE